MHPPFVDQQMDGSPSELIATGPFLESRWLTDDKILVSNYDEMWTYSASTGKGNRLYPPD